MLLSVVVRECMCAFVGVHRYLMYSQKTKRETIRMTMLFLANELPTIYKIVRMQQYIFWELVIDEMFITQS
jgi:hypothetical protein